MIMDYFIYLGVGVLIVVVLFVIILFFVKKENVVQNEMLAELTDEQMEDLRENEVEIVNDNQKKFSWLQKGLIGQRTDKGNNYSVKVLWFYTVIENQTLNDFQYAEVKIEKDEADRRCLKKGSLVRILIEPHKPKITIV